LALVLGQVLLSVVAGLDVLVAVFLKIGDLSLSAT
jgi:hypothetical protein